MNVMADMFSPEKRSALMARIHSADTSPELSLRRLIHGLGYRFRVHRTDLPGKPDIVMAKHRLIIFMHGCFWHGHKCLEGRRPGSNTAYWNRKLDRNMSRDKENLTALRRLGWRCSIVWECQLRKPALLRQRLLRLLEVAA